jgi:hypothetical protein
VHPQVALRSQFLCRTNQVGTLWASQFKPQFYCRITPYLFIAGAYLGTFGIGK